MSTNGQSDVLVSTAWVAEHGRDARVRVVEVDVDTSAYAQGHVDGAVGWNWQTELQDPVRRDVLDPQGIAALMRRSGISNDTTVVLYGDHNNWFACWALWLLAYYGHAHVRLMDGGRKKWVEEKRPLASASPAVTAANYAVPAPHLDLRAGRDHIFSVLDGSLPAQLVDVRSLDEFTGRIIAPPGMAETAQRGGHVPGAANIPWAQAVEEDGRFKPVETLRRLYAGKGITGENEVITYCRIGERSAHTWFVLRYLLGFSRVRNYDGSWTEWGNIIGAPIEKEMAAGAVR